MRNENVIREDAISLYVMAGGYVCRPVRETSFRTGDRAVTHHFGGTIRAGVGKAEDSKRGQYVEYWTTTGTDVDEFRGMSQTELADRYRWYLNHYLMSYPFKG